MSTTIEKLTELFCRFPGIGPRQARRFVYHLLSQDAGVREYFAHLVTELREDVRTCPSCFRYYIAEAGTECTICSDESRDKTILMIIGTDADFEAIKKSGAFNGRYFILGGIIPILEKNPESVIRIKELLAKTEKEAVGGLKEIVFALSANPEGDYTVDYLKRALAPLAEQHSLRLTVLGRGLSTGTELEYIDTDTLKNALKNRE